MELVSSCELQQLERERNLCREEASSLATQLQQTRGQLASLEQSGAQEQGDQLHTSCHTSCQL